MTLQEFFRKHPVWCVVLICLAAIGAHYFKQVMAIERDNREQRQAGSESRPLPAAYSVEEALVLCQIFARAMSKDQRSVIVPPVPNRGARPVALFVWDVSIAFINMRDEAGNDELATASCIVDTNAGVATSFKFNGEEVLRGDRPRSSVVG